MSNYWKCACGFFNENKLVACRKCNRNQKGATQRINADASAWAEAAATVPPLQSEHRAAVNPTTNEATQLLTIGEAADLLRLEPKSVCNKMNKGILKRGVHWWKRPGELGVRFDREALIAWVKEGDGKQEPTTGIPMVRGYFVGGGK